MGGRRFSSLDVRVDAFKTQGVKLRRANPVSQVRRQLAKMLQIKRVDALASSLFGAPQMEGVVDAASDPAFFRAFLKDCAVRPRTERQGLKVSKQVFGNHFPCLHGMNGRMKGSACKDRVKFTQPVSADVSSDFLIRHSAHCRDRLRVMRMACNRGGHEHGGVEVGFHKPARSLIRSSRTSSSNSTQSSSRGSWPK